MLCRCKQHPVEPGRTMCKFCLAKRAKSAREQRQRRYDIGLCIQCGKNSAHPPRKLCDRCRERNTEYTRARRQKLKDAGLCISCKKKPAVPGRAQCEDCLAQDKKRATIHFHELKAAGLCPGCQKPLSETGVTYCANCRAKKAAEKRHARNIRKDMCLCTECGALAAEDHALCEKCLVKKRDSHRQDLRDTGLCTQCETTPSLPGEDLCQDCLELKEEKEHRRALADQDLCIRCEEQPISGTGQSLCKTCGTEWYRDRIQRNVCLDCQQSIEPGNKLCPSCQANRARRFKNPFSKSLRNEIKKRDGFRCRICGKESSLCIHHIDGHGALDPATRKRRQGNNHPDNLITLCGGCHAAITRFTNCADPQTAIDLIRAQTNSV